MIQSPAGYQGDVRIKRYMDFYQAGYGVAMLSSGTTAFTPASLFAASEPGGWYDPSDLTTLFQEAISATPVTAVEQPVGLVLDKSKGMALLSELISNPGAPFTSTTGWSGANGATLSVVGGKLRFSGDGSQSYPRAATSITTVVGKVYKINYTAAYVSGTEQAVYSAKADNQVFSINAVYNSSESIFTASATTTWVGVQANSANNVIDITSFSVKEVAGAHVNQFTAASRPVLSARVNLLTRTEELENSVWTKLGTTVTANQIASPTGTTTADLAVVNNGAQPAVQLYHQLSGGQVSTTMTLSGYVKKSGASYASIGWVYSAGVWCAASFDLDTQTLTRSAALGGFTIVGTPSITALANGWFRISITATTPATAAYSIFPGVWPRIIPWTSGNPDSGDTGNGTSGIYIWGADLRPANAGVGLPAYQRVTTSTDYDTTGFPLYLKFDGTDDFLVSGTINPGSVDKAQVFAGVRKLSDAAEGSIAETSSQWWSNSGSLFIGSSPNVSPSTQNWAFGTNGTAAPWFVATTYAAPISSVLSCAFDLAQSTAADEILPRINAAVPTLTKQGAAVSSGTGNYASYPLYVGRRGGSILPFNGYLYSLIVRFSATNMDAATIASTETWVNSKTGAY